MKEIRAYIQPFMLSRVIQALQEIPNFPGITAMDCEGFGREKMPGQEYTPFQPKKRIEIFVPDDLLETVLGVLMSAANTHQHGAGKVYVTDVQEGGRISSGERGTDIA